MCAEVCFWKLSSQRSELCEDQIYGFSALNPSFFAGCQNGGGLCKCFFFASWHNVKSDQQRTLKGQGGGRDFLFLVPVCLTCQASDEYAFSSPQPAEVDFLSSWFL